MKKRMLKDIRIKIRVNTHRNPGRIMSISLFLWGLGSRWDRSLINSVYGQTVRNIISGGRHRKEEKCAESSHPERTLNELWREGRRWRRRTRATPARIPPPKRSGWCCWWCWFLVRVQLPVSNTRILDDDPPPCVTWGFHVLAISLSLSLSLSHTHWLARARKPPWLSAKLVAWLPLGPDSRLSTLGPD